MFFRCVPEKRVAVVERCGRFSWLSQSGCLCIPIPCVYAVAGLVNLQITQLNVKCESKTKDNVFVTLVIAVQYEAIPERVYEAYYRLSNPHAQINAFVFDVVRSTVPRIDLDELFVTKAKIAEDVKNQLSKLMADYGFRIRDALVIDIDPDEAVKAAMNDINASRRLRLATQEKAEAQKIMAVKQAEGEAESKYLHGLGIARQRQAIIEGLQTSVSNFTETNGMKPKDVLELLLITQHFDMLEYVGQNAVEGNTIFISHDPGSIHSAADQIRKMLNN